MEYTIGNKKFPLQNDFTYEELEWLEAVMNRLNTAGNPLHKAAGNKQNEVSGSFSKEEIEKTLKILLPGFTHEDFLNTRESLAVKIIADFFLSRAVLGNIMQSSLQN